MKTALQEKAPPSTGLDPDDVRAKVREFRDVIERGYVQLARLLSEVEDEKLYRRWGFKTFAEYVEAEVAFDRRKVQYLQAVWRKLGKGADESKLQRLEEVGWTRARVIAPLADGKNDDALIEEARRLPRSELEQVVKARRIGRAGAMKNGDEPRRSFQFLAQGDQVDEIERALKHARTLSGSDSVSQNLSLICLDFNASRDWSAGTRHNLAETMANFEKQLRARIIVLDGRANTILFGEEHIEAVAKS